MHFEEIYILATNYPASLQFKDSRTSAPRSATSSRAAPTSPGTRPTVGPAFYKKEQSPRPMRSMSTISRAFVDFAKHAWVSRAAPVARVQAFWLRDIQSLRTIKRTNRHFRAHQLRIVWFRSLSWLLVLLLSQ